MDTVWLTRTEPGASRQAQYLRERGYRVLVAPLLEIAALDPPQLRVNGELLGAGETLQTAAAQSPRMIIAVSGHAVCLLPWPSCTGASGDVCHRPQPDP